MASRGSASDLGERVPDLASRVPKHEAAKADVVVVAAGSSSRMRGVDKLSAAIGGKSLLEWTLEGLARSAVVERIVVVTGDERVDTLPREPWLPARVASVVRGGMRRQESVAAGVAELVRLGAPDDRVVLVHDGARPAVRPHL